MPENILPRLNNLQAAVCTAPHGQPLSSLIYFSNDFFLRFSLNFLLLNFTPSLLVIPSCTVLTILSLSFFGVQDPFKLICVSHQSSSSKAIDMALSFFLIFPHHLVPSALIALLLLSPSQQFVNIFVTMLFPGFHAILQVWPEADTYQVY